MNFAGSLPLPADLAQNASPGTPRRRKTVHPGVDRKHLRHRAPPHHPIEGLSNGTALAMVFKLVEGAQKSWRRLDGHNQLPKLVLGVTFNDGIEVIAKPTNRQPTTAVA
jgi:hypothetical protein